MIFPEATSVPKPLQKPHPPIWVAARAPITYDYAVKTSNIMSRLLTRPMSGSRPTSEDCRRLSCRVRPDRSSAMRHTCACHNKDDWMVPIEAARRQLAQFENLFKNAGGVENGFRDD